MHLLWLYSQEEESLWNGTGSCRDCSLSLDLCLQVCAKEDGGLCGGLNHVEGECGDGLQCIVRQLRNNRNRMKQSVDELVGRCEHGTCSLIYGIKSDQCGCKPCQRQPHGQV